MVYLMMSLVCLLGAYCLFLIDLSHYSFRFKWPGLSLMLGGIVLLIKAWRDEHGKAD